MMSQVKANSVTTLYQTHTDTHKLQSSHSVILLCSDALQNRRTDIDNNYNERKTFP